MPEIIQFDLGRDRIEVSLTKTELHEAAQTRNGVLMEETEIAGSKEWAAQPVEILTAKIAKLIVDNPYMVELRVTVNKDWVMKKLVTKQEVLFPDGMGQPKEKPSA
jgi:hypothetical protein